MKLIFHNLLFLTLALIGFTPLSAQEAATEMTTKKTSLGDEKMVFYGIDFTKSKMIGEEGFTDPDDVVNRFFKSWNNLLKTEKEKYDLEKFLKREKVYYDIDKAKERNLTVDPSTLVKEESHSITEADVAEVVANYKGEAEADLGFIFVVQSFDKIENKAFLWPTFFNTNTGEVIATELVEEDNGGFGLRNYWASSFYRAMENLEDTFAIGKKGKKKKKKKKKRKRR